jgi:transcription elongation factor GreA
MIREIQQKLQAELKALDRELIHELPKEIKKALAMGDLRENAEYHSALDRQSYVKARIGQIKRRLSDLASFNYDAIPRNKVGLGSTVKLVDLDTDADVTYRIVMNDDAEGVAGQITVGSPMARGLLGREVGDEVAITIPSGTRKFEIVELRTIHDDRQAEQAAGPGTGTAETEEPPAEGEPGSGAA